MFGMKQPINTKIDHQATFRRSIDLAINAAKDAHVSNRAIISYLRSRAQALEDAAYAGPYTPPRMYGQDGKLIDYAKQAEEARAAREKLRQEQEDRANKGRVRIR